MYPVYQALVLSLAFPNPNPKHNPKPNPNHNRKHNPNPVELSVKARQGDEGVVPSPTSVSF